MKVFRSSYELFSFGPAQPDCNRLVISQSSLNSLKCLMEILEYIVALCDFW